MYDLYYTHNYFISNVFSLVIVVVKPCVFQYLRNTQGSFRGVSKFSTRSSSSLLRLEAKFQQDPRPHS